MSNPMVADLFMECFDCCRNACMPAVKMKVALQDLHNKRAITSCSEKELEDWFEALSTAAFIFINFNQTLKTLIRF